MVNETMRLIIIYVIRFPHKISSVNVNVQYFAMNGQDAEDQSEIFVGNQRSGYLSVCG